MTHVPFRYRLCLLLAIVGVLYGGTALSAATPTPKPPPRTAGRNTSGTPYGVGIFRIVNGVGVWALRSTPTEGDPTTTFVFGQQGDVPLMCDWDGNGTRTPGIFRNGLWGIRNSNSGGNPDASFYFGQSGDIPVCGDWTGQGKQTVGVFRAVNGYGLWLLRNSNGAGAPDLSFFFGSAGGTPEVGDWTGQGKQTIGVYDVSQYRFSLRYSNTAGPPDVSFYYGNGSINGTVVGNWDGQAVESVGITTLEGIIGGPDFEILWSVLYCNADPAFCNKRPAYTQFHFGTPGDIALVYK